ncbi:MAG: hypothetical protein LBJ18_00975 [Rickettsiales bacterium]|jgi:hypothetical protein|nr:hypothetical protein [Rickettsiales bacterium]
MASNEKFLQLAGFYNQLLTVMSAICVNKGGIAAENYVGRFFAADVLQFLVSYGEKLGEKNLTERLRAEFEKVKDLATPSQKPIFEMTLEEFEKVMNI